MSLKDMYVQYIVLGTSNSIDYEYDTLPGQGCNLHINRNQINMLNINGHTDMFLKQTFPSPNMFYKIVLFMFMSNQRGCVNIQVLDSLSPFTYVPVSPSRF
jgi:hypothetical protein